MPVYVYQCITGHRSEQFKSMDKRLDAVCLECGEPVWIVPTVANHRMSHYFEHFAHDGTLLNIQQTTEHAPEPGWRMDRSTGDFITNLGEV